MSQNRRLSRLFRDRSRYTSALSARNSRVTGSGQGNESLRNGRVAGLVASSTTRTFSCDKALGSDLNTGMDVLRLFDLRQPTKVGATTCCSPAFIPSPQAPDERRKEASSVLLNAKAGRFGDNSDAQEHFMKLHEIMSDGVGIPEDGAEYIVGPC